MTLAEKIKAQREAKAKWNDKMAEAHGSGEHAEFYKRQAAALRAKQ